MSYSGRIRTRGGAPREQRDGIHVSWSLTESNAENAIPNTPPGRCAVPVRVRRLASHRTRGPGTPGGLVNDAQRPAAAALLAVREEAAEVAVAKPRPLLNVLQLSVRFQARM
jgi:hypothetical protein